MAIKHISDLDQHRKAELIPGYPENIRILYSPIDDVKGALTQLVESATHSLTIAMYGFDDDELAALIHQKMTESHVYVQLTLDKSQAGGVHERKILAAENYPATSIAIGSSEHGRIQHMKMMVVDGVYVVGGSTNWSSQAETLQDNELTVIQNPILAAEATARISSIHATMLAKAKPES